MVAPVLLFACEGRSLKLSDEAKIMIFKNKILLHIWTSARKWVMNEEKWNDTMLNIHDC